MPFVYTYEGEDSYDMPLWSCRRKDSGICGFGHTQKQALEDFLDKEQELVPPPRSRQVFSSQFEPPEFIDEPRRDEDYL